MSTIEAQARHDAGTFTLTEKEAEELERACVEADEEDRAGKLIPLEDLLAELRRT